MVLERTQVPKRVLAEDRKAPSDKKSKRGEKKGDKGDKGDNERLGGRRRTAQSGDNEQRQLEEMLTVLLAVKRGDVSARVSLHEGTGVTSLIASEVNDLVRSRAELGARTRELEERVSKLEVKNRELSLASGSLEDKVEELVKAARHKNAFLASMSHELRTPLNSLLILAKMLEENHESRLSDKQVEYATTISASGHDLLTLIDEILDLARIESGKVELLAQRVPLAELYIDMERTFRQLAQQKGLEFAVQAEGDLPKAITTDQKRLQQILKNLLANAFKFTSHGRITLALKLVKEEPLASGGAPARRRAALAFTVTDTGIGIAEERHQIIFDAFQQADDSVSRAYGGTGLGLTISRELTRLLGGEISVTSVPGYGSTFTLLLPIEREEGEARSRELSLPRATPARPLGPEEEPSPGKLFGRRVLVVDNDPRSGFAVASLLENRGAEVIFAESAQQALLTLRSREDINLVLMDIMMPEMNGYEATQEIRKLDPYRTLPIIALTAKTMPGDRERCIDAGCSDFIPKPVDNGRLLSVMDQWLRQE